MRDIAGPHRVLPIAREFALHDAAQTRVIERTAAAGLPPHTLMARAGDAVARLALALAPNARRVFIAAGPGNNGGDGFETAVNLMRAGKAVELSFFGDAARLPADAADALSRARAAGVQIGTTPSPDAAPDIAIDALLGVGADRAPGGAIADAIRALNALQRPVLAVDLPSGLDAATGNVLGDNCIVATHTLALLSLKPGLFTGDGRDHAGDVWLDALGVDPAQVAPSAWLGGMTHALSTQPRRHSQHKGSFGDVIVVAGAPGMSGAALLASRAAHAAGAGRVFVELLDATAGHGIGVDLLHPELMFRHGAARASNDTLRSATIVCGCGGGDAVRAELPRLLGASARLVLDADALNAVSADSMLADLLRARAARGLPTVLTPHPLEAARLLGSDTQRVQADRLAAARELSENFACVVVLKGSGTVIAAPNRTPRINSTGNASLATAGTGDVLAGWIGGRWAQGATPGLADAAFAVACLGVAEHGAAAEPQPAGALRASDLIERLYSLQG